MCGSREGLLLINESKQQHINQNSTLGWNKMSTQQQDQTWKGEATKVQQLNPGGVLVVEDGSNGTSQLYIATDVWLTTETLFWSRYGHAVFFSCLFLFCFFLFFCFFFLVVVVVLFCFLVVFFCFLFCSSGTFQQDKMAESKTWRRFNSNSSKVFG